MSAWTITHCSSSRLVENPSKASLIPINSWRICFKRSIISKFRIVASLLSFSFWRAPGRVIPLSFTKCLMSTNRCFVSGKRSSRRYPQRKGVVACASIGKRMWKPFAWSIIWWKKEEWLCPELARNWKITGKRRSGILKLSTVWSRFVKSWSEWGMLWMGFLLF